MNEMGQKLNQTNSLYMCVTIIIYRNMRTSYVLNCMIRSFRKRLIGCRGRMFAGSKQPSGGGGDESVGKLRECEQRCQLHLTIHWNSPLVVDVGFFFLGVFSAVEG